MANLMWFVHTELEIEIVVQVVSFPQIFCINYLEFEAIKTEVVEIIVDY